MTIVKLNIKNHSAKSGEKHLHVHLFFDFRKIKIPTKIPIKRIARTAIIIPIISPLPILFLKIIKYYIHTHAFINFCYYCISSFFKRYILLYKGTCSSLVAFSYTAIAHDH